MVNEMIFCKALGSRGLGFPCCIKDPGKSHHHCKVLVLGAG